MRVSTAMAAFQEGAMSMMGVRCGGLWVDAVLQGGREPAVATRGSIDAASCPPLRYDRSCTYNSEVWWG